MTPYKELTNRLEEEWNTDDQRYNTSDKYSTFRQNIWVSLSLFVFVQHGYSLFCFVRIFIIQMNLCQV